MFDRVDQLVSSSVEGPVLTYKNVMQRCNARGKRGNRDCWPMGGWYNGGTSVPWRVPDPRHSSWYPEKTPRSCNASSADPPIRDRALSCNHRSLLTTAPYHIPNEFQLSTNKTFFSHIFYLYHSRTHSDTYCCLHNYTISSARSVN